MSAAKQPAGKPSCPITHYYFQFRCTRVAGHWGKHSYHGCSWVDPNAHEDRSSP